MERARKLYLKTFGCQMNDADSSKIKRLLADMNIRHTDEPKEADILLLNTCSIRWRAEHKVYSELGRFKKIKKNYLLEIIANRPWFPASFLIQKVTYTTTVLKQSIGYIPSSQNFGYNTSVKKQEYKNNLRVNSVKQLI